VSCCPQAPRRASRTAQTVERMGNRRLIATL
jgi:hypothetical protein